LITNGFDRTLVEIWPCNIRNALGIVTRVAEYLVVWLAVFVAVAYVTDKYRCLDLTATMTTIAVVFQFLSTFLKLCSRHGAPLLADFVRVLFEILGQLMIVL